MKSPMREVLDYLHAYDLNRGKADIRVFIYKMLEKEKQAIVDASNNSHNKYIVDQINSACNNNKMFGENYYSETYKENDTRRDY